MKRVYIFILLLFFAGCSIEEEASNPTNASSYSWTSPISGKTYYTRYHPDRVKTRSYYRDYYGDFIAYTLSDSDHLGDLLTRGGVVIDSRTNKIKMYLKYGTNIFVNYYNVTNADVYTYTNVPDGLEEAGSYYVNRSNYTVVQAGAVVTYKYDSGDGYSEVTRTNTPDDGFVAYEHPFGGDWYWYRLERVTFTELEEPQLEGEIRSRFSLPFFIFNDGIQHRSAQALSEIE